MAAALLRSKRARIWADILAPAAGANAAGALWQNLRFLPAPGTTSCFPKLPKQPLAALLCQNDTVANKQQRITPLRQATEQPGQTAASQGGPGQEPVKQQVKQDTLLKELKTLLVWPLYRIMARSAMSLIPTVIEEEFDGSQFLEGCKDAFVAVHESMHSTRDLATMVSLPVLNAYEARQNKALAQMGRSLLPMPGIAADDEYQDCPEKVDAKEAQTSFLTDLTRWQGMVGGSSLVIRVRFSGCSFVLETRDCITGDLIGETLDQRCSTWVFGRGPLPNLTYPVHEFGADLPWVVFFTE